MIRTWWMYLSCRFQVKSFSLTSRSLFFSFYIKVSHRIRWYITLLFDISLRLTDDISLKLTEPRFILTALHLHMWHCINYVGNNSYVNTWSFIRQPLSKWRWSVLSAANFFLQLQVPSHSPSFTFPSVPILYQNIPYNSFIYH